MKKPITNKIKTAIGTALVVGILAIGAYLNEVGFKDASLAGAADSFVSAAKQSLQAQVSPVTTEQPDVKSTPEDSTQSDQ